MNTHQDTIVALATAPGIGAIGIIRISGTAAFPIVNTLFPSKDLNIQKTHTIHYGPLFKNNQILDEVNISEAGYKGSFGVMVNYLYELKNIEKNHEDFVNNKKVICSERVKSYL